MRRVFNVSDGSADELEKVDLDIEKGYRGQCVNADIYVKCAHSKKRSYITNV
jgi:hypothetical protein